MIISIIATVYNLEKYLPRTVESILNSTYQDFELILVDDGSTDGSAQLCDQLAGQDNRIRVIHKANAGVSEARNTGLENARGRYVMFVDGDDLIHPNMLTVLLDAINGKDYDFSMVLARMVTEQEAVPYMTNKYHGLSCDYRVINQRDYMEHLFGTGMISLHYQSCCNKLFKRDFIQNLKFIKTGSEDTEWNNRMAQQMHHGILVDEEMYFYIQRPMSITHSGISPNYVDRMNSYLICLDNIPADQEEYRTWCLEKLFKVILHTRHHARHTSLKGEATSIAKNIYKKSIGEFMRCDIPWTKKYSYLLFYHVPLFYSAFMSMCEFSTWWHERRQEKQQEKREKCG